VSFKWALPAVVLCAAAALFLFAPVRMAGLAAAGRGSGCTIARALEIESHKRKLTTAKDNILRSSKLMRVDERGLEQYQTPYGVFWSPKGSKYVLPFNLAEQEIEIYGSGAQAVQKGDVVLDCGANVGTFARFALDAGAAKVVAIEPAPENIECLRRNFPNEIASGRFLLVEKGVWDKEDFLELMVDPENQAADSFVIKREGAKAMARVPLTSIDRLVKELSLEKVDYIKMDIEGAEVNAVRGARETIAKFHPRMSLSVYHQDDHPVEVPKAAREAWDGYRVECGPCAYANGRVRPDILYFLP
jgi:FkbM family methyltransferase